MKITRFVTTCLIAFSALTTYAQDNRIITSKEFEFECSTPYPVVDAYIKQYTSKDGNVVSFKMIKGTVTLQKFDGPNYDQSNIKVYNDFPKGTVYEDAIDGEDFFYLMYSVWDKANQREQLFIRKIDKANGEFTDQGQRIIAVDGKVTGGNGDKFLLAESYDHSKILVHYRKRPEHRNDKISKDVIGLYVFDKELNPLWGKDVEMPYTEAQMNNVDYAIDGNGNVLILKELMNEGETRRYSKDNEPNFIYQLIFVSESGVDVNTSDIDIKGKYVTQVNFYEGKEAGTLILAGFYGNKRGIQVDGIFYCKVTNSGEQSEFLTYEIPTEIIKQYKSQRSQNKMDRKENNGKDLGMTNMVIRGFSFDEDGGLLISSEEYYVVVYRDQKNNSTSYTYYFKDILITKIKADGELAYWKKLPKYQYTSSSSMNFGGLGYRLITTGKYYYFIFLDNIKNLNLAENQVPARHAGGFGGFLTAYQVNIETGEVKKLSILDTKDAKGYKLYQFGTGRMTMVSENQLVMESYVKKKKDMMVKITIKD